MIASCSAYMGTGGSALIVRLLALALLLCPLLLTAEQTAYELVEKFECGRCHQLPEPIPQFNRRHSCVACHKAILDGELDTSFTDKELAHWKGRLTSLVAAPSLVGARRKFKREWLISFLMHPHSVRTRLGAEMPRMQISLEEAKTLATLFSIPDEEAAEELPESGDVEAGRVLLQEKSCLSCHELGKSTYLEYNNTTTRERALAVRMAPNLAYAKDRLSPETVMQWLANPASFSPGTLMPDFDLAEDEISAITAYLFSLNDSPVETPAKEGLAIEPLNRTVTFAEVNERILDRVCRHCHYDPATDRGHGGPGNTGGFGYAGIGLDLSTEQAVRLGKVNPAPGARTSILTSTNDSLPRIVEVLLARHLEQRGDEIPGVLGMPLGLPPIPMEDIRLLYTWCLQEEKEKQLPWYRRIVRSLLQEQDS